MREQRVGLIFAIVLGVLGRSFFSGQRAAHSAEHQRTLPVYPEATGIAFVNRGGADEITYHVNVKYPASDVTEWISNNLQKEGWKPLTNDLWNPGLPLSITNGWRKVRVGPKPPGDCLRAWVGEWKDTSGDIVRYDLRYKEGEQCTSEPHDLEVNGMYLPSAAVEPQRPKQQ
jgi:hypothetical protein